MPGSHSKKDKLKKKIRKARKTVVRDKTNEGYEPTKLKGKKRIPPSRVSPNWAVTKKSYPTSDYQRKVEYEQDKELGEDAVSVSESNAKKYSKLKKRIAKIGKDTRRKNFEKAIKEPHERVVHTMDNFNIEDLKTPKGKKTLEKVRKLNKDAKVRKADQQDINRVKRWDSRSFNKKKELSGTTEPVFKTTGAIKPLTTNLRNRLAKIRKANGGIAPNYNNPSKVRKKKTATKAASHTKEDMTVRAEEVDKFMKNSPSGEKMMEDVTKNRKRFMDQAREMKGYVEKGVKINPSRRTTGKKIDTKLRKKLAKQKTALRSAVNKGVNKVNPIKPTKTYKDTINPQEEDPDRIKQNATTIGRKPTYTGKARKRLAKFSDWKPKKGKYPVVHPEKYSTGGDLLDRISAVRDYKKGLFTPEDEIKLYSQIIKHGMPRGYKGTSFGKPDIEGFAQGADATIRTGVISEAGEINWEQFEDLVGQLDKGLGEGKTTDEIAETAVVKKVRPPKPTDKDRGDVMEAKLRNKIARIRKAGEQVDPRVKKRKTVRPDSPVQKVSQMKDRIGEMKIAKDHSHSIAFRKHEGQYYRRASLAKQEGKYAKYWLLNAKQTNGNGWGVSPVSIAKNINKFIGRPFVVTAKQWIPESEYGDQFEHPYLPTNNIDNIINHQEKFRVGSIVDVVEKDGDYHAVIEINSKFANMMLPPFCSPAIFQNNPGEADGEISDWEALHLAGLMEDPAYGARIALLKGSCMGTADACSIQFKAAKQTTMCPKKKAKLVRRIDRLGD